VAKGRADDRTPPHNIEAEEAVLGAALLARSAADVVAALEPSDFYAPAHRPIAAAIGRLVAADRPVDGVTVGDEIRRNGEATLVPEGTLHRLQNTAPSIGAAAHYGDIVRNTARLRGVLYAAADIADAAYTNADPGDVLATVSDIVGRLGTEGARTSSSTLEVADVAALLETDLEPEEACMMIRADGKALIYAGKMHMFQAEPTSGKSWLACYICAEVLGIGGSCVWIDHEDSPQGIIGRMLALGVEPAHLGARFRYVRPLGKLGPLERAELFALVAATNPDVIIIDGVAAALVREGYDEQSNHDVEKWTDEVPRPLARTGAAVVMLDHVAKDKDSQGRWARGAGAKLGVIDAASYQVKVMSPFARHRPGKLKLVIAKDRPGGVGAVGEVAAIVNVTPHGNGARVVIELERPPDHKPGDAWAPTHIMERVSEIVEASSVPLTATGVIAALPRSPKELVRQAIARLVADGYLSQTGTRTKTLAFVKGYTDPDPITPAGPPPPSDADYSDEALFDGYDQEET
jgi:hypothetical protein